ncbi:MAG: hypothetical protein ACFFAO_02810 [Candidatus Hermodarchaeota archaeon]
MKAQIKTPDTNSLNEVVWVLLAYRIINRSPKTISTNPANEQNAIK